MSASLIADEASSFDDVAARYEAALNEGLRLSGEGPEYFAERRVAWTDRVLAGQAIQRILDFGCGVGLAVPQLARQFDAESVWGFDPSQRSIDRARGDLVDERYFFTAHARELPADEIDLAYCNGVFHHIPPEDRPGALATIYRAMRPGGWFALWENNPWNPGTRWVMSRIPFDRDAQTLSPLVARRMVRIAGFDVRRTDSWFLFPHALRWLRPLESLVHRMPLGGQYLVLCQKPATKGGA
jgi:SAM-dependent methyltransferase